MRNLEGLLDPANAVKASRLKVMQLPTLFVIGGHDRDFSPELLRMAAEILPGAAIVEFPQSGHSPYWMEPGRSNYVVGKFLDRCWGG